jgi:hypothetical protein
MNLEYVEIEQAGRTYRICKTCNSYISSTRCLSCEPLTVEDIGGDMRPEMVRYYELKRQEPVHQQNRRYAEYTMHHILEYWFTSEQLMSKNLYLNVPKHHLLKVKSRDHHRVIEGYKLHKGSWFAIPIEDLTPEYAEELIKQFPKRVRELFEVN